MGMLERTMLHGNAETLVLALLARQPQHGYQIRKELATRSQHYFQVAFGRLYPLLAAMEQRGLVTSRLLKAGKSRKHGTTRSPPKAWPNSVSANRNGVSSPRQWIAFSTRNTAFTLHRRPVPFRGPTPIAIHHAPVPQLMICRLAIYHAKARTFLRQETIHTSLTFSSSPFL